MLMKEARQYERNYFQLDFSSRHMFSQLFNYAVCVAIHSPSLTAEICVCVCLCLCSLTFSFLLWISWEDGSALITALSLLPQKALEKDEDGDYLDALGQDWLDQREEGDGRARCGCAATWRIPTRSTKPNR